MLPGVTFIEQPPPAAGLTSRADVAMFAGLVAPRSAVSGAVGEPVAVESFAAFDARFAWDERPVTEGSVDLVPSPLGLAVRSFFAAGGARAWVVPCGAPLPLVTADPVAAGARLLAWAPGAAPPTAASHAPLLPGLGGRGRPMDPADPASWHGAARVFGLDEVAILCLPDLPDLCAGVRSSVPEPAPALAPPEAWKPCAPALPGALAAGRAPAPPLAATRLDAAGYQRWSEAMAYLLAMLDGRGGALHRRDVMVAAGLPSPAAGIAQAIRTPLDLLELPSLGGVGESIFSRLGSARLQLGWPWLATEAARRAPEGVEAPDGILAGTLAAASLAGGAHRSIGNVAAPAVRRLFADLARGELARPSQHSRWAGDRLCVIGRAASAPGGFAFLSDATMAGAPAWRAGGVSRLTGVLIRAARELGQDLAFEPSGPRLWSRARSAIEALLRDLWTLGALAGTTPAEAFQVRCDSSTMSQAALDAGRLIVEVSFTAAQPVERVTVTLTPWAAMLEAK